jgi:hypothetical protein
MSFSKPVRDSLLEIDHYSWIIGDRLILSLQPAAPSDVPFWSDGKGAFYTICELPSQQPLPQTHALPPTSPIKLTHDAGDSNAAWRIGEAFLKVQKQSYPRRTREHATLNYLHDPANGINLASSRPRVLYHNEFNERYYLVTTRIAGETLEKAWPVMDEMAKQACVDQVVNTCKVLSRKENKTICGVDGGELSEPWMNPFSPTGQYSHESLLAHCKEIGMDDTSDPFVLYHCDMGPTNVVVDISEGCKVGIIDWEVTGFVPKSWIRTKFCVCGAMNFDFAVGDVERSKDWRQRVQLQLAEEGFSEVAAAWRKLFLKNYDAARTTVGSKITS